MPHHRRQILRRPRIAPSRVRSGFFPATAGPYFRCSRVTRHAPPKPTDAREYGQRRLPCHLSNASTNIGIIAGQRNPPGNPGGFLRLSHTFTHAAGSNSARNSFEVPLPLLLALLDGVARRQFIAIAETHGRCRIENLLGLLAEHPPPTTLCRRQTRVAGDMRNQRTLLVPEMNRSRSTGGGGGGTIIVLSSANCHSCVADRHALPGICGISGSVLRRSTVPESTGGGEEAAAQRFVASSANCGPAWCPRPDR